MKRPKKQQTGKPKSSSKPWFIAVRGSYLPNSWQAWLLYVPYTAFLVGSLRLGVQQSNGLAAVVLQVFPAWVAACIVMHWIATIRS